MRAKQASSLHKLSQHVLRDACEASRKSASSKCILMVPSCVLRNLRDASHASRSTAQDKRRGTEGLQKRFKQGDFKTIYSVLVACFAVKALPGNKVAHLIYCLVKLSQQICLQI